MSVLRPTTREFVSSFQSDIERHFRVRLPSGVRRTTYAHRLDDVNIAVMPQMPRICSILDVAVSSGVSTIEWVDFLGARGVTARITATDIALEAFLYTFKFAPKISVLADCKGEVLHVDILSEGFFPHTHIQLPHPLGLLIRVIEAVFILLRRSNGHLMTKEIVPLVLPSLKRSATVREDDLSCPNPPEFVCAFDVIRAANILNPLYFPEATLRIMVANLRARLKEQGILIICRTNTSSGRNNGTIFKNNKGALSVIERIGEGSEIEQLVCRC